MGRYDGEEYENRTPCSPRAHKWGMNGTCFICNHDQEALVAEAKLIIKLNKEGGFGSYGG